MLLILDIISHHTVITQVTGAGNALIPCRCLKTQGVNTKSETSCTANDIMRQVEKHVFGKDVRRRMSDQRPSGRKSTPFLISRVFVVVFSWMSFRMWCPVLHVSLPKVYDKMAEINGFTVLQLLFEGIRLCQTVHGRKV